MLKQANFYSVIIGTELLNGRRKDAHFAFLNEQLLKRGWTHKASFVIEDDTSLMENIYKLIKEDKNSVMFSYGGIGATPDDYTRQIAAKVFRDGKMEYNQKAQELIINQFGQEAYPHRIEMGNLPINAKLLKNVVNNVAGFYLDDRFFFTPGFPSMSQSMVIEALDKHYAKNELIKYRKTLTAFCGENDLISLMKEVPSEIELSSLPKIIEDKRQVVLSLSSSNKELLETNFEKFINFCQEKSIKYTLEDINQVK
ncbi:competence/damage-inducible protein A [Halarcobacter bivalviorum]|uniref:Molybdopterin-binding protein n=1 Tax=Halarcobacter bivalviorum TaxID=663364 RepID=A0AAX2ABP2_9BACT|nr:molybdopterin-binding protein [Halarcobacter bivalviorum]AXH11711.1 molybdopterin-binding protein, CinA family [Halarcobacter bivalviorum]RXK10844.1 molybdopterin-binding protein [Halarcobacter bivalviorum]